MDGAANSGRARCALPSLALPCGYILHISSPEGEPDDGSVAEPFASSTSRIPRERRSGRGLRPATRSILLSASVSFAAQAERCRTARGGLCLVSGGAFVASAIAVVRKHSLPSRCHLRSRHGRACLLRDTVRREDVRFRSGGATDSVVASPARKEFRCPGNRRTSHCWNVLPGLA
jgi:hypothetical protein